MAIQYKNQPFDLTTDVMTTVLTLDESSRAIIQNIQAENTSTGTVDVASAVFDFSATATTQMSTLTTQNIAKGPVVLEEQDALKIKGGTANVIKGLVSYALITGDQGTA